MYLHCTCSAPRRDLLLSRRCWLPTVLPAERDELAAAAARCYDGATLDRQCSSTLLFLRCWQLCGAAAMASCCWLTVGPALLAGCRRRGPEPATWTVPCAGARLWRGAKGSCFSSTLAVHPEGTRLPCLVRPTTPRRFFLQHGRALWLVSPAVWLTGSLPPHTATLLPFGV